LRFVEGLVRLAAALMTAKISGPALAPAPARAMAPPPMVYMV